MGKITIIGAGHVGASTALYAAEKELGDVLLIDVVEGLSEGKSLDLLEGAPLRGYDVDLSGSSNIEDLKGSDIIVMTAGLARKPGMSRLDLIQKNTEIVKGVSETIKKHAPDAFVVMVTNPLDIMTYVAKHVTGFPKNRVFGMAGVLDSTRFRTFIAKEINVSVCDVSAMVLGGHGDSMVPLPRYACVSGVPIQQFMDDATIDRLIERTRKAGGEIVAYLKTGSAYYSPAASVVEMLEAVVRDKKRFLPAAAYLDGEYGMNGIYLGVPVILGAGGVEKVVELEMLDEELTALKESAKEVEEAINDIKGSL
jgi:malate dehydrogenase